MRRFRRMSDRNNWVWKWFTKSPREAQCITCLRVFRSVANKPFLIRHLQNRHGIDEFTESPGPSIQPWFGTFARGSQENSGSGLLPQELPQNPEDVEQIPARKRKRESRSSDAHLEGKHSLKTDMIRLICECHVPMTQIISSPTIGRLLRGAYPNDPPPPKSMATLRNLLEEQALQVESYIRMRFQDLQSKGHKVAASIDEATFLGTDRYLTLDIHHGSAIFGQSRTAPLGLIRVQRGTTTENLRELIIARLRAFGLTEKDLIAAVTGGASKALEAVEQMGITKQKCFAQGLDLVVRKTLHGAKASDLQVRPFNYLKFEEDEADSEPEDAGEETEDFMSETKGERPDEDDGGVELGEALQKLRRAAWVFQKRPSLMDELRRTTAKDEYNRKPLGIQLDCRSRWYSTVLMIERAAEILPALNHVLSSHGIHLSERDIYELGEIHAVLTPFKRAILNLREHEPTLWHADRIFRLLLEDLRESGSELAIALRANLVTEIAERRTIFSSVLAVLKEPRYDFALESACGQAKPSAQETLNVLADILNAHMSKNPADREAQSTATVTWDSIFDASSDSSESDDREDHCNIDNLQREFSVYKAGGGRGPLLKRCREVLQAIPPTSVRPAVDSRAVRALLEGNRAKLSSCTLDACFMLRRALQYGVI